MKKVLLIGALASLALTACSESEVAKQDMVKSEAIVATVGGQQVNSTINRDDVKLHVVFVHNQHKQMFRGVSVTSLEHANDVATEDCIVATDDAACYTTYRRSVGYERLHARPVALSVKAHSS